MKINLEKGKLHQLIDSADSSGVASSISEGDIFIFFYPCSAQLNSFEIKSISKELNCPEHEYMNMSPSLIELATPLADGTDGAAIHL